MRAATDFLDTFASALDAPALPERLAARYRLDSELGHRPSGGAYLLRHLEDNVPFVLKIDGGGQDLEEEYRLLGRLPEGLAPEPVDWFEEGGTRYLVRTYIPGQSLAEAWEPGISFGRWAELGARLCGLLAQLHRMEPPIVHRDIKPENIILAPDGTPYLIDFGIARSWKPERETDTVHLGTSTTAAPEQYGFAQTDPRTDLYALGVTLRWMATGSYQPEALERADCPGWVKRFLRKAAAFDPADRFPSADAMAFILRRHTAVAHKKRKVPVLAVCLVLAAGLLLLAAGARQRPVDFGSPLLEAAVRSELDRPKGTITREDLKEVRRLAVVGETLVGEDQTYFCDQYIQLDGVQLRDPARGDISDLSVLSEMPNLTTLYLCCQEISDLAPLEGLPLKELYLHDNNIRDLTPLERLPELRVLHLSDNPAEDLTPLAALTKLRELNLSSQTNPESLAPLRELPLEKLYLIGLEPQDGDWSFLGTLRKLDLLWMDGSSPASIAALEDCGRISDMFLWSYEAEDLTELPVLPRLGALSLGWPLASCEGIQRQEALYYFSFQYRRGIDLSPLAELEKLVQLGPHGSLDVDFSPLLDSYSLELVFVHTEEMAAAIEADCPNHRFEIQIE